ncbi:hypothetical protein [Halobacillus mangrovi]|uniref:hypothetical protein n=1 Tax=Halobacillus mangrovi TaxID=402384 RepID=UPI003D96C957
MEGLTEKLHRMYLENPQNPHLITISQSLDELLYVKLSKREIPFSLVYSLLRRPPCILRVALYLFSCACLFTSNIGWACLPW